MANLNVVPIPPHSSEHSFEDAKRDKNARRIDRDNRVDSSV
ncbi:hypothetical protein PF005_g15029 [Phytophthora fragariae]|uniref:Uncharacterized protein n=1 Tax=Phytophthora fragariae TaxID=53985 RepID=A0A6A3XFT4_9STRA|nr:hypothetical protein PF003_g38758 [Phytophthora fragariae]KAE8936496.1 hypothetical protein PF009_g13589 [Phytophthora fragariae]KAE9000665.1 hypothetical protein PF011_g14083 [Phytophthora fragariae]KAE9100652.1 hypothetical protein PF007_g15429 [Phytophthora fragariae]KAE9137584.1 hypothetical protein PF006_g14149 [Phytophthora fragariae]